MIAISWSPLSVSSYHSDLLTLESFRPLSLDIILTYTHPSMILSDLIPHFKFNKLLKGILISLFQIISLSHTVSLVYFICSVSSNPPLYLLKPKLFVDKLYQLINLSSSSPQYLSCWNHHYLSFRFCKRLQQSPFHSCSLSHSFAS